MALIKTSLEQAALRTGGQMLGHVLHQLTILAQPKMRLTELEREADHLIRAAGAVPAFKGYRGYSSVLCTSVNNEVVHCPPTRRRLNNGDILSIDIGLIYQGMYLDSAVTIPIGNISTEAEHLIHVTRTALHEKARAAIKPDNTLGDIGYAIQTYVEGEGLSVVRDLVGHGIGSDLHEEPPIPNFGKPRTGLTLQPGMAIAVEPMVNIGRPAVVFESDGWRVVTKDGSLSAHFEHTFLITDSGCDMVTAYENTRN